MGLLVYRGLEQFIEKNRDQVISSRDEDGNTPLHIAAVNNHMDIVCLLCDMVRVHTSSLL